jgi:hypothetical protein
LAAQWAVLMLGQPAQRLDRAGGNVEHQPIVVRHLHQHARRFEPLDAGAVGRLDRDALFGSVLVDPNQPSRHRVGTFAAHIRKVVQPERTGALGPGGEGDRNLSEGDIAVGVPLLDAEEAGEMLGPVDPETEPHRRPDAVPDQPPAVGPELVRQSAGKADLLDLRHHRPLRRRRERQDGGDHENPARHTCFPEQLQPAYPRDATRGLWRDTHESTTLTLRDGFVTPRITRRKRRLILAMRNGCDKQPVVWRSRLRSNG